MKPIGEITLPQPTPSGNRVRRMSPHAYKRLRDNLTTFLRFEAREIERCEPGEFRRLTLERRGPRELDPDNLAWGMKPLVDALRIVGLIEDDSPKHVAIRYEQSKARKRDGSTIIKIETMKTNGRFHRASQELVYECEAGHTAPAFGCIFCILRSRGLESWRCSCGDDWLPEIKRCNTCGATRPGRFDSAQAFISEAAEIRERRDHG